MLHRCFAAAAMLFLYGTSLLQAEDTAKETARHLTVARRACCSILIDGHLAGSGCCVDPNGTGLTAAHLLGAPKSEVDVLLGNEQRVRAKLVAVDLMADLALFKLPEREEAYPFLHVAKAAPVVTEAVVLIGSPIFRRGLVMRGNVASDDRRYEFASEHYIDAVYIAGPSPPGSSGGPWINAAGELVGVQSAAITIDGVPQGIAVSSPLAAIRRLIAAPQNPRTPSLGTGVEELWGQEPKFLEQVAPGTAGLVLRQVRKDGPINEGGLSDWDIVTHFDGEPVQTVEAFVSKVRGKSPGDVVTLSVVDRRGRNPRDVKVPIAHLGAEWDAALKRAPEPPLKVTGSEQ